MTLRQLIRLPRLLNRKPARSITPLQILKPIHRNPRRARRKLQETGLLLGVPATDALPEVLYDFVVLRVAAVVGVLLPVVDVDVGDAADEQLEFALVEDVDQVRGDELVEARDEGLELLFDALLDAPFGDESVVVSMRVTFLGGLHLLDIFALVVVGHFNLLATGLQLDADGLTESLIVSRKGQFKCVSNVVVPANVSFVSHTARSNLQHPFQVTMEIRIHTLHVLQRNLLPQNHLVKCSNEESVQKAAMENGQTNNAPNELEVVQMLGVDARMRVNLKGVVVVRGVLEKAVEGVEHLVGKQEEELSGETAVIQTVFAVKLDHQSLLQISSALPHDLVVRVLEDMRPPNLDVALPTNNAQCWLRSEVDELAAEVTLVLRHVLIER
jgi:hypothetical protein